MERHTTPTCLSPGAWFPRTAGSVVKLAQPSELEGGLRVHVFDLVGGLRVHVFDLVGGIRVHVFDLVGGLQVDWSALPLCLGLQTKRRRDFGDGLCDLPFPPRRSRCTSNRFLSYSASGLFWSGMDRR